MNQRHLTHVNVSLSLSPSFLRNERFRRIVQSKLEKYSAASSRPEKSEILSSIVSEVRLNSPDGGFVKQDTGTGKWFEVGDFLAREKTSQAFRDALHEDYRSSKKSKHEKRRQRTKAKAMTEKRSQSSSPGSSSGGAHQHEGKENAPCCLDLSQEDNQDIYSICITHRLIFFPF